MIGITKDGKAVTAGSRLCRRYDGATETPSANLMQASTRGIRRQAVHQHRSRQQLHLADQIAAKLANFVVAESGFGADIGAEVHGYQVSYNDVTPRSRDGLLYPCLKMHSGKFKVVTNRAGLTRNLEAVARGQPTLRSR